MIINEEVINPEVPKMLPNEQYLLYAPVASINNYGLVKIGQNDYLKINNGELTFDDGKLLIDSFEIDEQYRLKVNMKNGSSIIASGSFENLRGPKGEQGEYATIDTELSGSSINPVQNKVIKEALDEIDSKTARIFHYKGTVSTVSALDNIQNPSEGDVWHVTDTDAEYVYTSDNEWEFLGANVLTPGNNITIENDKISAKSASCKILGSNGLSFGSNSIANAKGFAIKAITNISVDIYLHHPRTRELAAFENDIVGKYFSIISNTHFAFCGVVTRWYINTNDDIAIIYYTPTTSHGTTTSSSTPWWTLQTLDGTNESLPNYAPLDNGVLWFPELPELGYELKYGADDEYSFFEDSTAIGDTCYASADDAFVNGESNVAGGNHAVIFGKLNKGGYGNIMSGIQNFSNGLHSALFGRHHVNHGDYNLLGGHTVTVEGNYHSIHGYLVTEDYATRGNCDLGGGYNISFGGRCHLFGGRDHTIRGENHLIGGRENNVQGTNHTVGGLENNVQGVNHTVGGYGNTVSGTGHAVFGGKGYTGYNGNTVTNGYNSFVAGTGNTLPSGMWSFIFGFNNDFTGSTSHVYGLGRELHPAKTYQFLTGRANVDDSGAALVVGNGTSASSRSNCFTVGASGTRSNVDTDAVTVEYFNSHMPTSVEVDDDLSATSENPVQNKIVTQAMRSAIIVTFTTTVANTDITLRGLTGMTSIDWGDGTVGKSLYPPHRYTSAGTYICRIYGVTSIGNSAFQTPSSYITKVVLPNTITSIGSLAFNGCKITSLKIPDSVSTIGENAFDDCTLLKTVTIGTGLTSMDYGAFRNCSALEQIVFESITPPTMGHFSVLGNTNNCPIYVPRSSLATYKAAAVWSTYYASRIVANATTDDVPGGWHSVNASSVSTLPNGMYFFVVSISGTMTATLPLYLDGTTPAFAAPVEDSGPDYRISISGDSSNNVTATAEDLSSQTTPTATIIGYYSI